jgi:hypothetical protein
MAPSKEDSALLAGSGRSLLFSNNVVVDLERRNRRRQMIALTVCSVLLALVGAIAVWSSHLSPQRLDQATRTAAAALAALNKNQRGQARSIDAGCETTVMILRHCEKFGPYVKDDEGNFHCSYLGFERAKFIATLFGNTPLERWPAPAHLFALSPDRDGHWNFREWETLHPTAQKVGVAIDVAGRDGLASEIFDLLQSGSMCGQLAVISWSHEFIPELAMSLGCGPENGCPDVYPQDSFDEVWQLKYAFHPFPKNPKGEKNAETTGNHTRRHLNAEDVGESKHGWSLYATISNLNFDALSFSKSVGDYPLGGTPTGGRWDEEM